MEKAVLSKQEKIDSMKDAAVDREMEGVQAKQEMATLQRQKEEAEEQLTAAKTLLKEQREELDQARGTAQGLQKEKELYKVRLGVSVCDSFTHARISACTHSHTLTRACPRERGKTMATELSASFTFLLLRLTSIRRKRRFERRTTSIRLSSTSSSSKSRR